MGQPRSSAPADRSARWWCGCPATSPAGPGRGRRRCGRWRPCSASPCCRRWRPEHRSRWSGCARLGLTRDDVAAALGISRNLYAGVEQGKRTASVPETAALAAALHTSADQARRALPPSLA
ncbi:helix-turn-helix domain-containing protein [Streptomyces sp. NPDC059863]|uniref:helix-turn-helix domain-containing protein n=1 Tax=unclassified Streptomyces TaxID=2593676 RepID=UPI003658255C